MGRSRTQNDANQKWPLSRNAPYLPWSVYTPHSGSSSEGRRFKPCPRYHSIDKSSQRARCFLALSAALNGSAPRFIGSVPSRRWVLGVQLPMQTTSAHPLFQLASQR